MVDKMIDLDKMFNDYKTISESSLNLYKKNLIKLNDNKPIKNFNFLNKIEDINNKIEKYKPNTRRSYIISIVSILKCATANGNKKLNKLYDVYFNKLMELNKELKDQTEKTPSENINWISQEELQNKYDELKNKVIETIKTKNKINEDEYNLLLSFVIFSLYYLNEPRRNMDYQKMKIVKVYNDTLPNEFNYLDLKNKKFVFNNYKTKGTYNKQITDINDELYNIIKFFIKFNKNEDKYLLSNYNNNNFTNINDITRILNKIFNKKIGSSMLRKMHLTNKFGKLENDLEQSAKAMGTSVNMLQNVYIKK